MKKYNIGDSVKFKDGRIGIVEDYDNKYYYVKDDNTNVHKVIKDRSRLSYEYEPEPEEECESYEERKERHEKLVEEMNLKKELKALEEKHDLLYNKVLSFCKENCENINSYIKTHLSEYKEKLKKELINNGFEIKNKTINTEGYLKPYIDKTDFYECVGKIEFETLHKTYTMESENIDISISCGTDFTNIFKGEFIGFPYLSIYFDYDSGLLQFDLMSICDELGLKEGEIKDYEANGWATNYTVGPFSLFE